MVQLRPPLPFFKGRRPPSGTGERYFVLSLATGAGQIEHCLDLLGARLPHMADPNSRRGGARRRDSETFGQFDSVWL